MLFVVQGGDEAKFKEINEAYDVLRDSEKRSIYDRVRRLTAFDACISATSGALWLSDVSGHRTGQISALLTSSSVHCSCCSRPGYLLIMISLPAFAPSSALPPRARTDSIS